jgi:hypothetical protein
MSSSALTTSTDNRTDSGVRRRIISTAAVLAALVLALAIGHDLLHMPLQVSDSLSLIADAARVPTAWQAFFSHLAGAGYFRPMFYAEIKLLYDLTGGDSLQLVYRLFHALLIVAYLVLFVRALQVRDALTLAAGAFALTVFVGMHTFLGGVKEIYPTNHFLQVALLALLALNLAQSRGGLLVDLGLLVSFTVASLILESGLLVWVVIAAAWMAGMPGVSKRAVIGATLLLAGYFVVRFGIYSTGLPTVEERSTGYLLETLSQAQIRERFGDNLWPLYGYNFLSSISSVLFSEPRSGVWRFVRSIRGDQLAPRHFIWLGASLFSTGLLVAYVTSRLRAGVRRPVTLADRHVVVFAAVLVANAAMSYVYTKDEIMGTAGAFYGLPVYGAMVYFLRRWPASPRTWQATAFLVVLYMAGSGAWAVRAAGVHHVLRSEAFLQRNDWTQMERQWRENGNWEHYADQQPLVRRLRDEAVATPVVNPRFVPGWAERVFDIYY